MPVPRGGQVPAGTGDAGTWNARVSTGGGEEADALQELLTRMLDGQDAQYEELLASHARS